MATPNVCLIVRSFLDFLHSVECSDDKSESLKVATDCLKTAFGLHLPCTDKAALPQGLLLDLFTSWKAEQVERSPLPFDEEVSAEDLLKRLYDAFLLRFTVKEDPNLAAKANQLFNEALADCCIMIENQDEIADFLKSKGNHAMEAKLYAQAAELYTEAISLCQENAFYFCNRAAAYIQLKKNTEAIKDCLKAIDIDPKYSKAYSRLGSAYFALGNYNAALDKGFLRALKLDPDNQTIQENVEMTRSKMNEERQANIRALCNPGQVSSFSSGSSPVNPDFLSDYIKGLVHLSQQRTGSEDPIKDLTDAFLQQRRESNPDSSDSSEDESGDLPNVNMSDVFLSAAQVFSELGGLNGAASQGSGDAA